MCTHQYVQNFQAIGIRYSFSYNAYATSYNLLADDLIHHPEKVDNQPDNQLYPPDSRQPTLTPIQPTVLYR